MFFTAAWLIPGHFPPWTAFQQQAAAALGAALIAAGATTTHGSMGWRWPQLSLWIAVLAAVPVVQYLAGQVHFVSDAILPSLYIVAFALCIAAGANLARRNAALWPDALMLAILVAAVVSTGLAWMQWLRVELPYVPIDPVPPHGRPFANLSQTNHLSTLLGLGAAALLYLYERRSVSGPIAAIGCAWLGWGLLMAQSRTGWLFVVCLVAWWWLARARLRLSGAAVLIGCGAFVLGVLGWSAINDLLLLSTPEALRDRADGTLRSHLWRAMIEAIGRSPWIGWGWNQVSFGHLAVAMDHDAGQRVFQNAHSIVLDLPLWMGLPLAAVVLASAGWWLLSKLGECRQQGPAWALMLAVIAIGVHAMTEYPLDYTYFLLTLGLLIGTLEAGSSRTVLLQAPAVTFQVPLAVCVSMLLWIGVDYVKVEQAARDVRLVLAGIDPARKASDVPPPETMLLDVPREYHRLWITQATPGMSPAQLAWMHDVVWRNPSSLALLRYALAAGLNDRPQEAQMTLRAICHIHPPKRCEETRQAWREAQATHAVLRSVPPP